MHGVQDSGEADGDREAGMRRSRKSIPSSPQIH